MSADALDQALAALARRERTAAELRQWLEARAFEPQAIDVTVERLRELGQLDDARFASRYAEDKRELRGWGPERIAAALAARGVGAAEIEAAVGPLDGGVGEPERAAHLLAERGEVLGDERALGRAFAYLRRRGYPADVAYEAVRRQARRAA